MKKFVAVSFLYFLSLYAFGGTKTPIGPSIEWGNEDHWLPSGVPANGDEVIIPEGYTVYIKSRVYKNTMPNLVITVNGTLQFEPSGKLELGTNSTLRLVTSAARIQSHTTGSELLVIGSEIKYNGGDGVAVISGPSFTSIDTPPSPGGFTPLPLPIMLTHFSARSQSEAVILTWKTAMEENARHFEIERSADAVHWQTLATVSVRGANTTYSYTDALPLAATGFYRLKLVDWDESVAYSPVAKVTGQEVLPSLQVGPNPASTYLNITLAQPGSQLLQLQVVSANGQLVKLCSVAANGYTRLSLDGFARGQYYLVIKNGPQILQTCPFVVN